MSGPAHRPGSRRILLALLSGIALAGCSGEAVDVNVGDGGFTDGTFTGRSSADDKGAWGEVTLTIAGNDVTAVTFVLRQSDGTAQDENYGKVNGKIINEETYRKAQAAVAAAPQYAARLEETDDLDAVDAITGASLSHRQFVEAVTDALDQARI